MEQNEKKEFYEIIMEVVRVKGEKNDKKYDFLTYEGYDIRGRKCTFKLTKAVNTKPNVEGKYVVRVPRAAINKDKGSKYNEYWIKEIESFEEYIPEAKDVEDLPF